MSDVKRPNRREFTAQSALALLSGVTITVNACSGGSSSPSSPTPTPVPNPGPVVNNVNGIVGTNHGHSAVITGVELAAGQALTLNIQGTSGHPHTVSVTASEVGQIAGSARVAKTSSNDDAHTHRVTFN